MPARARRRRAGNSLEDRLEYYDSSSCSASRHGGGRRPPGSEGTGEVTSPRSERGALASNSSARSGTRVQPEPDRSSPGADERSGPARPGSDLI